MKRSIFFAMLAISISFSSAPGNVEMTPYAGVPGWEETRDERMEWWREARFGLFVHWGLYAVAGGYWPPDPETGTRYPQHYSEWIQNWARVHPTEYAELAKPGFTAENYDASEWARLAKRAGMEYAVLTTKHHDGFTLFNSEAAYSVDNELTGSTNISPEGRDLVGEYTAAFRAAEIKIGYYYSLFDWQHPEGPEVSMPRYQRDTSRHRKHDVYLDYLHEHIGELVRNYGKVDIFWPDYSSGNFQGAFWRTAKILETLQEEQPHIVINNRFWSGLENPNSDFKTPEKYVPPTGLPGVDWEVCHTMNESFGFSFHDQNWKTTDETIQLLIDIVSKGGNLLLNVGPKADGTFPQGAVDILEGVGDWMDINSESIHGTTAGPFPELNWGRATRKGDTLYLHIFDWPEDGVLEVPLLSEVRSARLLGARARWLGGRRVQWENTRDGIVLNIPGDPIHSAATVVKLQIDGEPRVAQWRSMPESDGSLLLAATEAELTGNLGLENPPVQNIGFWTSADFYASWSARMDHPGDYKVTVRLACTEGAGGRLRLERGDQVLNFDVPITGGWRNFEDLEIGTLSIKQEDLGQDSVVFTLRAVAVVGHGVANIQSIKLTPIAGE